MMGGFKDFLNKTVTDAKTTFNRAQQKTNEVLGIAEKTEYDPQFEQLYSRVELQKHWLEKIVSAVYELQVPNPAQRTISFFAEKLDVPKSKENIYNNLTNVFRQASNDIGNDTSLGIALDQCSQMFKNADIFTNNFIDNSTQCFIIPITTYISTVINPALNEKKKLDIIRLDQDAAKSKLNKCQPEKAAELIADLQQHGNEFEAQLSLTRSLFEQINSNKAEHLKYFQDLIDQLIEYHTKMLNSLQTLKESIIADTQTQ